MSNIEQPPSNTPGNPAHAGAKRLRAAVAAMPDFAALSDATIAALAPHVVEQRVASGQPVLLRDASPDALLILTQGRLTVSVASPEGRALAFRLITPVDVVGEIGVLDAGPRSADVVAGADSVLLRLPRAAVMGALRSHPDLSEAMLRLLCRRLRETSRDFEGVATQRLEARLATLILRLADSLGEPQPGGSVLLPRRLSQSDLSMLVAATREAVNKQLGLWRDARLVSMEGGRLVLLNRDGLAALDGATEALSA